MGGGQKLKIDLSRDGRGAFEKFNEKHNSSQKLGQNT